MNKFLSPEERVELLAELKSERHRKFAERIKVILLLDEGRTNKSIAEYLFLDEGTIRNWRKRFKTGGLEKLFADDYKIKRSFLSEDELVKLSLHLEQTVFQRARDVGEYIFSEFGVRLKDNSVVRILRRLGFSYKKAKRVPSRACPEKQAKFIRSYNAFKPHGEVFFLDSTHPRFCPVLGYGWIKKGTDKFLPTNAGRVHLNITGAINIETLQVISRQSEVVNEDAICEMIRAVRGKKSFKNRIYLIMDNARYNKSRKVKRLAERLRVRLKYVPPYSPNLNLIERLWRFFREKILSMKSYESLDIFKETCSNFFRGIRKYERELRTLMTDNFQILGT